MTKGHHTDVFSFSFRAQTLIGNCITLEPLTSEHRQELLNIFDDQIWKWYTIRIASSRDLDQFLSQILKDQSAGKTYGYAVRENSTHQLIGSSRFMHLDSNNRRVEIGSTWFAPQWQRTFANTESKLLMLSFAFEVLCCISVAFQTDVLNLKSRKALERIGAHLDGIIPYHRICYDGRIRDSAFYSITAPEWPEKKQHLTNLLARVPLPK